MVKVNATKAWMKHCDFILIDIVCLQLRVTGIHMDGETTAIRPWF